MCRDGVVAFDTSSLSKLRVRGKDAEKLLSYACTNDITAPHCVRYTCLLNDGGGIESDFTVNKRSSEDFYVVVAGATGQKDFDYFAKLANAGEFGTDVRVEDVTTDFGVLNVQGRWSRKILERAAPSNDWSNAAFPAYTEQEIKIAGRKLHALRVTFMGELGWELHYKNADAEAVYDAVFGAGKEYGLAWAGYNAVDSLSVEKGFKHWHEDIQAHDTPLEAGLGFTCDFSKDFRGKDKLLKQKEAGLRKRLICLTTEKENYLWNLEPIYRDGECLGYLRRTHFGFSVGRHVGYGYVERKDGKPLTVKWLKEGNWEVEVGDRKRVPAEFHAKCVFDPKMERVMGKYGGEEF